MKNYLLVCLFIFSFLVIGLAQVRRGNTPYLSINKEGKYGFVDKNEKPVIPFIYENAHPFKGEVTPVKFNGTWKFINKNGQETNSISFDKFSYDYKHHWIIKKNNKWGVYNLQGELVVPLVYDYIKKRSTEPYFHILIDNKWGCVDTLNKVIVPPISSNEIKIASSKRFIVYDHFKQGLFGLNQKMFLSPIYREIISMNDNYFMIQLKDTWSLVDSMGQSINDIIYEQIQLKSDIALIKINGLWGGLDYDFNTLIPVQYSQLQPFNISYKKEAFIAKHLNKWGIINIKNEIIIPFEYDYLEQISQGFKVKKGSFYGVLDSKGDEVVPIKMDSLLHRAYNWVQLDGKWNYVNQQKKFAFATSFDRLEIMDYGAIRVERGNKWGVVDSDGKIIFPVIYELPLIKFGKDILVKKDGKYGLINSKGESFRSFQYDKYSLSQDNSLMILEKLGKYGLLKNNRELLLPLFFNHLVFINNSTIKGELKNKIGFFDKDGNVLEGTDESSTSFYHLLTKELNHKSVKMTIGDKKIKIKSIDNRKLKIKEQPINVEIPIFQDTIITFNPSTYDESLEFWTPNGRESKIVNDLGDISFMAFEKSSINLLGEFPFYLQQITFRTLNQTKPIGVNQEQSGLVKNTKIEEKTKINQIQVNWKSTVAKLSKGDKIYIEKATFYNPFYKKSFVIEHLYFQLK